MTIIASIPHKGESLEVKVTDVITRSNGRKLATVRALTGQPFMSWTHGGWCFSNTANIPVDLLSGVTVAVELPGALVPAEVLQ